LLDAQVFMPTAHIAAGEMVWDFDTWAPQGDGPRAYVTIRQISAAENHGLATDEG
jgi:hypothetical protein